MKFLEDTNATRVSRDDPLIVFMSREEGRVIGEVLRSAAEDNKRSRKLKKLADEWDGLAPVIT